MAYGLGPIAHAADITPHRTHSAGFCVEWARQGTTSSEHWVVCASRVDDSRRFGTKQQTSTTAQALDFLCANDGSYCYGTGFGGPIANEDLLFDSDGQVVALTTSLGPCAIDLTLSPNGASQSVEDHRVLLDGGQLVTIERSGDDGNRQPVIGTGSACDWSEVASRPSDYGDRGADDWHGVSIQTAIP
jgi:hypothetical protein